MGLELATRNVASGILWKKLIGGVDHDFWHNAGEHHSFDIESRLTAGNIETTGPIPVGERFFGGSYAQMFMPGDAWQIRTNPVVRAIPGSRYFETSAGAGANRYIAGNLTASFAVWQKPLVPDEVRKEKKF